MPRYRSHNGVREQLTPEEEVARDAEEKIWADEAFDRALFNLREKRNQLIAESDWRFRSDLTPSQAWKDYCQALRDLPSGLDTVEKVNAVTWPEKPE
jgi:hypothetical protein